MCGAVVANVAGIGRRGVVCGSRGTSASRHTANANGNFDCATSLPPGLWDGNASLCTIRVYAADAQLSTDQTPANTHFHSHYVARPPRLPPMVTRFVFLPLRPPPSCLDGHHCRVKVAFIHGHGRVRVRGRQ